MKQYGILTKKKFIKGDLVDILIFTERVLVLIFSFFIFLVDLANGFSSVKFLPNKIPKLLDDYWFVTLNCGT